jgi:hypothetical protein
MRITSNWLKDAATGLIIAGCFLSALSVYGETEPATPTNLTEVWYNVTQKIPGKDASGKEITTKEKKIGYYKLIIELLPQSTPGQNKEYRIKVEGEINKTNKVIPCCTLLEERLFEVQSITSTPGVYLRANKIEGRIIVAETKQVTLLYRATAEGDKIHIITALDPAGKDFEHTAKEPIIGGCEDIGLYFIQQELEPNQTYPIRLISGAKYLSPALLMIKEKILPETEKDIIKYRCNIIMSDPEAAGIREIECLIDANGIMLHQRSAIIKPEVEINIVKTTKEDALTEEKAVFERKGRDDPFKHKMTKNKLSLGGGGRQVEQGPSPAEIAAWIKEAEEHLAKMKDIADKLPPGEEKNNALSDLYTKILNINDRVMKYGAPGDKNQMMIISDEAERLFGNEVEIQLYLQAVYIRNEALKLFEAGKYAEVISKPPLITAIRSRKEIKEEYAAKIDALIEEVKNLADRAGKVLEFRPPKISGIVYYRKATEVSLPPVKMSLLGNQMVLPVIYVEYMPHSSALINNVACVEGGRVDANTTIKSISPKEVVFIYKGETIKVQVETKK